MGVYGLSDGPAAAGVIGMNTGRRAGDAYGVWGNRSVRRGGE